ncbi:MAG: pyridine nucleotide-disulfide oxidoreductase [Micrococcales bacterium]|nr:pyridine nucleotide-disulfide oxidoreductase [Microbacteriaceae bacterium]NBR22442.1 pyridine nucleotide-disulfide oxidoreductase [Micrococcales bacterium]NBX94917.1 pyridine nucleotide-disulfide oxidoreductase [Actinomycetota bacterium]NBR77385.1 pyridine nucleotide-disulfide oxidoreductase [Microbacteriaceae bacterium]NBS60965.1 pyridine nucleotide-disulfide oxidoreductase [Microbacteriaceae bacterium]
MTKMRLAIVGAGPAGIYAADLIIKAERNFDVSIDLFDLLPAPYGLVRYGVAPDHPRIKGIIRALYEVLDRGDIRFFGNVKYGTDITLDELKSHYNAVIFATGAIKDADLNIPGVELDGSYGAADFVNWYDAHPDVPRTWPLNAKEVAVIGNGNVALDVARILAKHPADLLSTDIPENVYQGLLSSPVTDVHVFGRRGPAQVKFTPLELREACAIEGVDTIVYDEDFQYDAGSQDAIDSNNQTRVMVSTLEGIRGRETTGATRRLHLHFFSSPAEILGTDGKVSGFRIERTQLDGHGGVTPTGEFREYPVQAVYRAVGYFGSELVEIPFDEKHGVISNRVGRVIDSEGNVVPGVYATGWIKRGPVGLIGHTKSDAMETIGWVIEDQASWWQPANPDEQSVVDLLESKNVKFLGWPEWLKVDATERSLGEAQGRERIKLVEREDFLEAAFENK